jgi:CubicO group peptidase (beta-lactamase class C family)
LPLLPETVSRVDELVAQAQARGRVPSLVFGVVREGSLVHVASSPAAERHEPPAGSPASGRQKAADLQYRIGSITKTMTAVLVMALRDEGQLALDDLLYRHLPGTPVGGVTLRQLLGHVGGMQREPDGPWWERSAGIDADRFLAELTPDKMAYPPLRGYHYSNLAYGLLGAIVARTTGLSWIELVGKRLLEPLGLSRTTYQAAAPFARGYVVHPWNDTMREEPRLDAGAMAPAGQLWSTVGDLGKWAAFLAEPDHRVLAPDSLAEMCAPIVLSDPATWTGGHGLGLQLWRRGERVFVGHGGSMPGYLAIVAVHRPSRTGVVGFANAYTLHGGSGTISDLGLNLLDLVLDREPTRVAPWRPAAAPPPEVESLTGLWWWMGRRHQATWDAGAQELVIMPDAACAPWRFVPDGSDRWRGRAGDNDGEILKVRRNRTGAAAALDIATALFTRDP